MSGASERPWGPVTAMVAVGLAVVVLGGRSSGTADWGAAAAGGEDALAAGVLDAHTIELAGGQTVRLIGVEAPEETDCYGPEALARTRELLPPGTPVKLEYDVDRVDGDGRALAYVHRRDDGLFVNLALAQDGFAREWVAAPNLAHVADLVAAVAEAETQGRGLWGACRRASAGKPTSPAGSPTSSECHPSYAGACVPVGVPDVDCAGAGDGPAFIAGPIGVVGPDEYQLDPDKDGVACDR